MKEESKGRNYDVKRELDREENSPCCGVEAGFKKEVKEIVNEVEGYDKADHTKKMEEVKGAFGKK